MTARFLLLLLFPLMSYSQTNRLFLTKENDSTLSVRDIYNQIIIQPYHFIGHIPDKKIELSTDILLINKSPADYELYDRTGNFLYKAAIFDFMAEFQEGHIPIISNDKRGLANKEGKLIIPAEYDWMGFLTNGIVEACKECYFDRTKDPEHPPLINGTWYLLNKHGEILDIQNYGKPLKNITKYPHKYTESELEILSGIEKFSTQIAKKYNLNTNEIKFELVYNPTPYDPFYRIKLYNKSSTNWNTSFDSEAQYNFFFDPKTKLYYGYYEESRLYKKKGEEIFEIKKIQQPLKQWLKNKKVTSY